jgi:hypothetical protein
LRWKTFALIELFRFDPQRTSIGFGRGSCILVLSEAAKLYGRRAKPSSGKARQGEQMPTTSGIIRGLYQP